MSNTIVNSTEEITFLEGEYANKMASSCNLVEVYNQGGTIVRIFDGAYANKITEKTDRTQDKVLPDNIMRALWKCVKDARAAGKDI